MWILTGSCCYLVAKSCPALFDPMDCSSQAPLSLEFSRQEYWSGLPCPSPGESSQPRDGTQVSCITGGFFTVWVIREVSQFPSSQLSNTRLSKNWSAWNCNCDGRTSLPQWMAAVLHYLPLPKVLLLLYKSSPLHQRHQIFLICITPGCKDPRAQGN